MKKLFERYIRPFWFASDSERIKPSYVYGFVTMIIFYGAIGLFLSMAVGEKPNAGVLGALAGVIATLAGLYFGIMKSFVMGKEETKGGTDERVDD